MVAESAVDALSAWQRLDPETQGCTQIISTGGSFSGAGKAKLRRLIEEAKEECRRAGGGKLPLVDASDVGEATTQVREDTLHAFADNQGVKYVRWAPDDGCKDWNDVVIAERRAQEAQEAAQEAASAEEVQRDDPTPDSEQKRPPMALASAADVVFSQAQPHNLSPPLPSAEPPTEASVQATQPSRFQTSSVPVRPKLSDRAAGRV